MDIRKFKSFTLVTNGFTCTMCDYDAIVKCFNWRESARLYGNFKNGDTILLREK